MPFFAQMAPQYNQMMQPPQIQPMLPNPNVKGASLYLGDLEEQTDDQIIFQRFKQFGPISNLKIFRSSRRKDRAHAMMTFATPEQAEKAKNEMNHEKLLTKEIRVIWYKPGVKPNPDANLYIKKVP